MNFSDHVRALDLEALRQRIHDATPDQVARVFGSGQIGESDIPLLFSPAADGFLEELAQASAALTERRFGRIVNLYCPLYLSNACYNQCTYCGFSSKLKIPRLTLTPAQVESEARALFEQGFRHILLVSGEDKNAVSLDYLVECVRRVRALFESIAIEIHPLPEEEYRVLVAEGVDGLALYQEVYDEDLYRRYHLTGPKRDYWRRLDAIAAGAAAGMRSLGIGTLLGLSDWRFEATMLAIHGRWLARRFWQARLAVSFPRIQGSAQEAFTPEFAVSDRDLVHMLCAMRLILPDAEMVISTRERAAFRDSLLGLGVTRTSAGSKTNPGGYQITEGDDGEQFDVGDERPPEEVAAAIAARGFEPVWKDFDRCFTRAD